MASVQKISPFLSIVGNGTEILMFNGGPRFKFTLGISLFVKCKDQAEVDGYWNKPRLLAMLKIKKIVVSGLEKAFSD